MILRRFKQAFKYTIKPLVKTGTNTLTLEFSKSWLDKKLFERKRSLVPANIDLIIVSYNSSKWIKDFFESLLKQTYPISKVNIFIIDNSPKDNTVEIFQSYFKKFGNRFCSVQIAIQPNLRHGTGYDHLIELGKSKYIFVTKIDCKLASDALEKVVRAAENDESDVALWELRLKPHEQLKYYDPVSFETLWSSHTAALIKRDVYEKVKGFEKKFSIDGENIELSYRFRAYGYRLKYCPSAVVWHYKYENDQVESIFYLKKALTNLYLKLKYGFYIIARQGSYTETNEITEKPLVSIITRITDLRQFDQLKCSIKTVANQTYDNIELIIVEDGGSKHQTNCEQLCNDLELNYKYYSLGKIGRSGAGNYGLKQASGEYLMFLDDDDYLFADHVETIMSFLAAEKEYAAGYSLAWEAMVDKKSKLFDCKNLEVPAGLLQEYDFEILQKRNFIPVQSIIFKKQLFLERGGFDESLNYLEDWNLWYRYGYKNKFKFIPKVTSIYTVTNNLREFLTRHKKMRASYMDAKSKAQVDILRIN